MLYVSGLQINDIEPFCQDEIVLYRQCAEKRVSCMAKIVIMNLFGVIELSNNIYLQDKEIRERLKDSEYKLGLSMPLEKAKERTTQLQSEVTLLERYLYIFFWFQVFCIKLTKLFN